MGFRADLRAACVTMLTAYAASASIKLQVYPGRPRSINPPTAFVDNITETVTDSGHIFQRRPVATVVVVHGSFDSADAAEQADLFMDGFLEWVEDNIHAAGSSTVLGNMTAEDDPTYVPEWLGPRQGLGTYFATRITVEGFGAYGS